MEAPNAPYGGSKRSGWSRQTTGMVFFIGTYQG